MPSSATSIEVTLRSLDGLDDFPERRFVLSPSTTMSVGRSSKNASKKLMSGADNAFIDSPVISRGHALLSASNALGIPTVFITDNGSMHGTFVNSHALTPLESHRLHPGDTLQFGQNVIRDQDSFIAKKYRFLSQTAPAISRGFSVPEMDTEEEEEIEEIEEQKILRTARYGSQANPVTLDDVEDNTQQVVGLEDDVAGSPKVSESVPAKLESPPPVARKLFTEVLANKDDPTSQSTAPAPGPFFIFNEDDISDDEHMVAYERTEQGQLDSFDCNSDSGASAEEEEEEGSDGNLDVDSEEDNVSNLSQASSIVTESESESDEPEPNADTNTARRVTLEAMLNLRKVPSIGKTNFSTYIPYTTPDTSEYQEPFHTSPPMDMSSTMSPREVDCVTGGPSNNGFGVSFPSWDMAVNSPLPRPIAPKPSTWGRPGTDEPGMFSRGDFSHSPWFEASPATTFTHMSTSEFRPTRLDYLGQVLNTEPAPTPAMSIPTPPIPTYDEANSINNQSNRRTKVSIPEIVEETAQQPPTPTSLGSSKNLKRKAEALGEDEVEAREAPQSSVVKGTVAEIAKVAQTAAEEPLAKRRRTTLAAVATNAASFIAGSAFAIGALLMLPEIVYS